MAEFRVLGTNHTSFTVSDLDRSIAYFRDVLGFRLVSHEPRDPQIVERVTGVKGADMMIAYLQGPGHAMELIQYLGPAERGRVEARPCDTGFAHVAFNVDDVDAAVAASAGHAVLPIAQPVAIDAGPNKGGKVVYMRDWDGVTVEFIQRRPKTAG